MLKKIKGSGVVILIALSLVLSSGCGAINKAISAVNSENTKVSLGTMEGTTYKNDYFGVSINADGWTVLSDEEKEKIMNAGKEIIAGEDKKLKGQLDLGAQRVLNLLTMYEQPLGSRVEFNSSFSCNAEKISLMQGMTIRTGKDYLENAKKLLQQQKQIQYDFGKDIYSEDIGGRNFDVMEVTLEIKGVKITQKYCSAKVKDYVLNIVITYMTDEQQQKLEEVLKSAKFK